jgi:signal transduction histidine kinase
MLFMNELARQIWKVDDEYQYKNVRELFSPSLADEFIASDRQVIDTQKPLAIVVKSRRKDGTDGYYMLHKFFLDVPYARRLIGGQAIDITEEKKAQDEIVKKLTENRKLEAALLEQKAREQKQVNQAIITAQDHERNELSKELHDNVNQLLSSASILLSSVNQESWEESKPYLDKSQEYINMVIQEIRKISRMLNTSTIKEVGLEGPVEDIMNNLRLLRGIEVAFDFTPSLEEKLSDEQKLMVYRIIQEQTNNIIKYAEAKKVLIAVTEKEKKLIVIIQDDGKGCDPEQPRKGIGLMNIRNRAEAFNGTMRIVSEPSKGCLVEVVIPLK